MIHNDRGLRVDASVVKKAHDVVVEVLLRVLGQANKDDARIVAERAVSTAMHQDRVWSEVQLLGRPNAKRATVAAEEG